jgi:hypothetical protein
VRRSWESVREGGKQVSNGGHGVDETSEPGEPVSTPGCNFRYWLGLEKV